MSVKDYQFNQNLVGYMGMTKRPLFNPRRQVAAFERLTTQDLITDLNSKHNYAHTAYQWQFRLAEIVLQGEQLPQSIDLDYTRYQLYVTHTRRQEPRVFIQSPILPLRCKHTWHQEDGRLCLYKPELWQWQTDMHFDKHLFSNVIMWIYHFEMWQATGIWYGEEALHQAPMLPLLRGLLR